MFAVFTVHCTIIQKTGLSHSQCILLLFSYRHELKIFYLMSDSSVIKNLKVTCIEFTHCFPLVSISTQVLLINFLTYTQYLCI